MWFQDSALYSLRNEEKKRGVVLLTRALLRAMCVGMDNHVGEFK